MTKKQKWETAGDRDEAWANNIPLYKDPVSGKTINNIGDWRPASQVKPSPVGKGTNGPGDSEV